MSLAVALATDSIVNAVKPQHLTALAGVADDLAADNAASRTVGLLGDACNPAARAPPVAFGDGPIAPALTLAAEKARLTHEHQIVMACLP